MIYHSASSTVIASKKQFIWTCSFLIEPVFTLSGLFKDLFPRSSPLLLEGTPPSFQFLPLSPLLCLIPVLWLIHCSAAVCQFANLTDLICFLPSFLVSWDLADGLRAPPISTWALVVPVIEPWTPASNPLSKLRSLGLNYLFGKVVGSWVLDLAWQCSGDTPRSVVRNHILKCTEIHVVPRNQLWILPYEWETP